LCPRVLCWRGFFHETTLKFTLQWFLTAGLGVITVYVLVQNTYAPGATVVATAYAFCGCTDDYFWRPEKSVGHKTGVPHDHSVLVFDHHTVSAPSAVMSRDVEVGDSIRLGQDRLAPTYTDGTPWRRGGPLFENAIDPRVRRRRRRKLDRRT
jgi:hypothetical protein